MIQQLNVIMPSYAPNNATTNRMLGFLRGFSELGVKTKVVFLISDTRGSKIGELLPNVQYTYMWEQLEVKNKYLRQLQLVLNIRKYVKSLPYKSKVLLLFPSSLLLHYLVKRKDLDVYYDETEKPEVYDMKLFRIESYYKSIQQLKGLFVISTSLKKHFENKNILSSKIEIVNMIVDSSRFSGLKKNEKVVKYIAYCGIVTTGKDGVDELIKAFAIVCRKNPDYKLYIIGRIPSKEQERQIHKMVSDLHLKDNVVFTGLVPYDKMPQLLKDATLLALDRPDNIQAKYGFPTKLGEYLLTENPVVVTRVGDITKFLIDEESAMISEPRNPNDFANKICYLLDNSEKARQIGKNGAEIARVYFNYKTEAAKMLKMMQFI